MSQYDNIAPNLTLVDQNN